MKVTVIRHAQSTFNVGIFDDVESGIIDCKLTDFGKDQASKLDLEFDLLILSPMKRALQTYVYSNIKAGEIITNKLFREKDYNSEFIDGKISSVEIENDEQLGNRVIESIKFVRTLDYKNVGIITHGCFIEYFLEECGYVNSHFDNTQYLTFDFR
jgi:broad specificity phosphatase PhoE